MDARRINYVMDALAAALANDRSYHASLLALAMQ